MKSFRARLEYQSALLLYLSLRALSQRTPSNGSVSTPAGYHIDICSYIRMSVPANPHIPEIRVSPQGPIAQARMAAR